MCTILNLLVYVFLEEWKKQASICLAVFRARATLDLAHLESTIQSSAVYFPVRKVDDRFITYLH